MHCHLKIPNRHLLVPVSSTASSPGPLLLHLRHRILDLRIGCAEFKGQVCSQESRVEESLGTGLSRALKLSLTQCSFCSEYTILGIPPNTPSPPPSHLPFPAHLLLVPSFSSLPQCVRCVPQLSAARRTPPLLTEWSD